MSNRAFKPLKRSTGTWSVDDMISMRKTIKFILSKHAASNVPGLLNAVANHYKQNKHFKVDPGQSVVALRQLVAEGDVTRDGDDVWLAKHTDKET